MCEKLIRTKINKFWKNNRTFEIKESEKGCLCCGNRDSNDTRFAGKTPNSENQWMLFWLNNTDPKKGVENIACPYCDSRSFRFAGTRDQLIDFKKGNCWCGNCEKPFNAHYG